MSADLADYHEPISDLFPRIDAADDSFELAEDQVAHYREHGFVGGIPVLDGGQIEALRSELAEFFTPDHTGAELWYEYHANEASDPGHVLFHALGAWRLRPGMHDILWHPAILQPARQLLDGAVRFWHDQLFCKPPHHGGVVAWHQD
ncbi:MAG: phytanoyl-CoA dioxygenase family protein, partial [Planctomycetales bacterium]|nr:phytanoyl-CoA dioxygenase family protein [Planctomycetales bacterium]